MCDHDNHDECNEHGARFGDALEHGEAHSDDHLRWSRRDFLVRAGLTAGGVALTVGGTPMRVLGNSPVLERIAAAATDRVVVLIQLRGGNDGLNMVVPVTTDAYYNLRPNIAVGVSETFALDGDFGLNNAMSSLQPMWGDGKMGVIHNVGYPSPSLSHFRGTDIWMTSEPTSFGTTGWVGRSLDHQYPDFPTNPNLYDWPFAIEVSSSPTVLFEGPETRMGIAMRNPEEFARLALTGNLYDESDVSPDAYGDELSYVRGVANAANRYAETIKTASDAATNEATYPNGSLGDSLATVARLIKGGLRTGIYAVGIGSFDTHTNQLNRHTDLLGQLADAVTAFQTDLGTAHQDKVLTMTYSEFGRRPTQNNGQGTDHGTGSAMLLWSNLLNGGLYGTPPDLDSITAPGQNALYGTDFRTVYSTVLERWFGLAAGDVSSLLGGSFGTVDFIPASLSKGTFAPAQASNEQPPVAFALESNYPNPFRGGTTISYSLPKSTYTVLRVVDTAGREVRRIVDTYQGSGRYSVQFDGSSLPSGRYFYRLETSLGYDTKTMTVVR